eukprot:CAMPEP_0172687910 /NCGR_PEP_ID=MMETSP1074-20121228/22050_1 /TAXON_ID=2916 /ORGANISM="Ceratium fusus, Strain PA161109" /LENGTH=48 /DNA_ID= /DNA_START= /DNA_END= /DNA_ORIENTATION=
MTELEVDLQDLLLVQIPSRQSDPQSPMHSPNCATPSQRLLQSLARPQR